MKLLCLNQFVEKKAYLYAFIAVINWSTVASAFKISLHYMDFINLLFFFYNIYHYSIFNPADIE